MSISDEVNHKLLYASVTLVFIAGISIDAQAQECHSIMEKTAPDSRFTINDDGTVYDTQTALTWKRCLEGFSGNSCLEEANATAEFSWSGALTLATNATFANRTWRLPNINELGSITEFSCEPAMNLTTFPYDTNLRYYPANVWSSSPLFSEDGLTNYAWQVDFDTGYVDSGDKDSSYYYVRLVSGGTEHDHTHE